jgi:hypothetical protein
MEEQQLELKLEIQSVQLLSRTLFFPKAAKSTSPYLA